MQHMALSKCKQQRCVEYILFFVLLFFVLFFCLFLVFGFPQLTQRTLLLWHLLHASSPLHFHSLLFTLAIVWSFCNSTISRTPSFTLFLSSPLWTIRLPTLKQVFWSFNTHDEMIPLFFCNFVKSRLEKKKKTVQIWSIQPISSLHPLQLALIVEGKEGHCGATAKSK